MGNIEVLFTSDLKGPSVKVLGDEESKRQRQRWGWATLMGISTPGGAWNATPRSLPSLERSEEHTSELQSHIGIAYAVFCLKKFF